MTIEQAISKLESCSIVPFMEDDCEAAGLAIAALKEQQERSEGCVHCHTGEPLNGYEDVGSFMILPKGKRHYLEIAFNDDFYDCSTDITYCPKCGRRLEENNG